MDDDGPGWEQQEQCEGRRWQEEQMRREAEAFERLMAHLWGALQNQWRDGNAESK